MSSAGFLRSGLIWLFGACLLAPLGDADAAVKHTRQGAPARRSAPTPKVSKIDILVGQLAANGVEAGTNLAEACKRTNFKNLATALKMNADVLSSDRGEFETAEEYAARASKLANAVNFAQTIVCQPLDDNEDAPFIYNADEGAFSGSVSESQNVWRDVKQLGTYRSKTRMGIPATIKASLEMNYDLALDLPSDLKGCLQGSYSYSYKVPVQRDRAPAVKANGFLVYLGSLVPPFVTSEERPGSPTLDDPYDVYNATVTAHMKPERLVVIDSAGNEIWSCRPGFYNPNQSAKPIGEPSAWISRYDYPYVSYGEDKTGGTVAVTLQVGADGSAVSCNVVKSSGNPKLDDATCKTLVRRARFTPATDATGAPVAGVWSTSQSWAPQ